MSDPIDLPRDDDRLAELPLVDSLHYEPDADGFSVIFVPSVGEDQSRSVFVPRTSIEGHQVSANIYRIQQLIGNRVDRIIHGGGNNYSLRLAGGEMIRLSVENSCEQWAPEVFDRLKQIARAAEAAFDISHAGHR